MRSGLLAAIVAMCSTACGSSAATPTPTTVTLQAGDIVVDRGTQGELIGIVIYIEEYTGHVNAPLVHEDHPSPSEQVWRNRLPVTLKIGTEYSMAMFFEDVFENGYRKSVDGTVKVLGQTLTRTGTVLPTQPNFPGITARLFRFLDARGTIQ